MNCSSCGKTTEKQRMPPRWKRIGNACFCPKCWAERYVLRAITLPVVGPVGATWDEFREAIKTAWSRVTSLNNWAMTENYARDVRRDVTMAKLPKWQTPYLYPDATARFPDVPANTVSAILKAVAGKYRAKRWELLWAGATSLPVYRYPAPAIAHNQSWKAYYVDDRPVIDVGLLRGQQRFSLMLRGGKEFYRQLADFQSIVSGIAVHGELAVIRQRANAGDHRNGVSERDGGGQKTMNRILVKMVGWFPRKAYKGANGTLYVQTDPESLLVALNLKEERLWIHHADHVRRWTAEHYRHLQRWSDDQKAEQRPTASYQSRRESAAEKYRHRMDTAVKQAAAMLVNYAVRRKFAEIRYDDSTKTYCTRFPWAALKERISTKCNADNILFTASATVAKEHPGALATPEIEE